MSDHILTLLEADVAILAYGDSAITIDGQGYWAFERPFGRVWVYEH